MVVKTQVEVRLGGHLQAPCKRTGMQRIPRRNNSGFCIIHKGVIGKTRPVRNTCYFNLVAKRQGCILRM